MVLRQFYHVFYLDLFSLKIGTFHLYPGQGLKNRDCPGKIWTLGRPAHLGGVGVGVGLTLMHTNAYKGGGGLNMTKIRILYAGTTLTVFFFT